MTTVIYHVDDIEENNNDKESEWHIWIKGENTPISTEPEDSGKEYK